MRLSTLVVVLLTVSLILGCAQAPQKPEAEAKKPIKIGAPIPLTGPGSFTGLEMKRGMLLAIKEINAKGGVLGRPIEIVFEDTKTNPDAAKSAVKRLVEIENVDYLAGIMSSSVFAGVTPDLKKYKKITFILGAAYSGFEEQFKDEDWFFHVHPYDYHNSQVWLNFLKSIGVKNMIVFYESGVFGTGSIKGLQNLFPQNGIEIQAAYAFTTGSGDFRSIITKAKQVNPNPDCLMWIGYEVDALPIVLQLKELDYNPKVVAGTPPSWSKEFMNAPESEYVIGIAYWNPLVPTKENKEFLEKYVKEYGEEPKNYFAPLAYATIMSLAKAIELAGTFDEKEVIKALEKVEIDTPMGKLKYSPAKIIKHQGFDEKAGIGFQWRGGKQVPVWPPEKAIQQIVYPVPKWSER